MSLRTGFVGRSRPTDKGVRNDRLSLRTSTRIRHGVGPQSPRHGTGLVRPSRTRSSTLVPFLRGLRTLRFFVLPRVSSDQGLTKWRNAGNVYPTFLPKRPPPPVVLDPSPPRPNPVGRPCSLLSSVDPAQNHPLSSWCWASLPSL